MVSPNPKGGAKEYEGDGDAKRMDPREGEVEMREEGTMDKWKVKTWRKEENPDQA